MTDYTPELVKTLLCEYQLLFDCCTGLPMDSCSPLDVYGQRWSMETARACLADVNTAVSHLLRLNPDFGATLWHAVVNGGDKLSETWQGWTALDTAASAMSAYLNRAKSGAA